jgi:hypothetical protein
MSSIILVKPEKNIAMSFGSDPPFEKNSKRRSMAEPNHFHIYYIYLTIFAQVEQGWSRNLGIRENFSKYPFL